MTVLYSSDHYKNFSDSPNLFENREDLYTVQFASMKCTELKTVKKKLFLSCSFCFTEEYRQETVIRSMCFEFRL
jgi:hypothetical protein